MTRIVVPEILLVGAEPAQVEPALDEHFTVHKMARAKDPDALVASVKDRVRGAVTGTLIGLEGSLIDALPNLEIIVVSGGHLDRVDVARARARGIPVTNTPHVSAPDVADFGIALLLAVCRRVREADRFVRAGGWLHGSMPFGRRVSGKRLGIVGFGSIGRIVARRAEAFEMAVCYYGPRRKPDVAYPFYEDVAAMAADMDFLILSCKMNEETRHMIDARVLHALGPEGVLINIARGGVVDQAALIQALSDGTIAAAGLDVFADEPDVPEALCRMENVVLQAHAAAFTIEGKTRMANLAVDNLLAHFAGKPLLTPVP